jgi:type I restriction enzyme S subunit
MKSTWKNGRVKDLIDYLESGVSVNGEDRAPSDTESAVLKVSAVSYGVFDPGASKLIIGQELKRAKCNPKAGQIIVSRSNTPDLVGASAFIARDYPNRYLPDKLWQTVPKKDVASDLRWLAYYLASSWARFRLSRLATGTSDTMKNITQDELLTLPVLIPPFPEQVVIADLLSTWDAAIEKTEWLIAAKEGRFKGLVQRLITEPSKTNGCWKHFRIRDIAKRIQRVAKGEALPILTIASSSGFVLQKEKYSRYMAGESVKNYICLRRGEFAYNKGNSLRFQFGCIFELMEYEAALVPHVYVCFKLNSGVDPNYLGHLFAADYLKRQLGAIVKTGIRNNGLLNIKPDEFMDVTVPMPLFKEQQQIAATLNTARDEIDLLKKQAEAFRRQKRGLMQKLLTGEWRVRVGEGDTDEQRLTGTYKD